MLLSLLLFQHLLAECPGPATNSHRASGVSMPRAASTAAVSAVPDAARQGLYRDGWMLRSVQEVATAKAASQGPV